jgi:DNA polymerase-4
MSEERSRRIAHLDMDAFFAAVEQLDRPELRGRPVIVGGLGARGVVSTASYEARAYGVGSAMPMARARGLCPQAAFLRPRFHRYQEISTIVRRILQEASPILEPVSLDEAFFDLSERCDDFDAAETIVAEVKRRVEEETGLTCSVGLAPNRFLAKLASELAKPAGLVVIVPDRVHELLDPLPVERVWGVGPVTARRLHGLGVRSVRQLRELDLSALIREFGAQGRMLHRLARGLDETPVSVARESQQVSREVTFPQDVRDAAEWESLLRELAADVAAQLQQERLTACCVRIKVRFPDFRTETRQVSLDVGIDSAHLLGSIAVELLHTRVETGDTGLRLLGVGVARLLRSAARQLSLFEAAEGTEGVGSSRS